jgi:sugar phosphate isomerase/epimerase
VYSRRDFGKIALASFPISLAFAKINSRIDGVRLGVQTYSFRDLPLDAVIHSIAAEGLGECELFSPHIEGGHTDRAPMAGMRPPGANGGTPNPADAAARAAARTAAREELRKWRLAVPMDYFHGIRQKFSDAGITIVAYNLSFNDSFTDDEIDRGFDMAKAVGAQFITASSTLSAVKRVAPFADKHKMVVAMHGHSNTRDPNQFAKPESFAQAMAMSKYFKINLDIGHFTAAGYDAVPYIQENYENILLLHLKDRKKDDSGNTPWGEGDTPIKQTLLLLKEKKYPIPAYIEYEYQGTGTSQEEVKKCFDYCKAVLRSDA